MNIIFKLGEKCGYCDDSIVIKKKVFTHFKADPHCFECGGSGDKYLSDGIYTSCECITGYGGKVDALFCESCCSEEIIK